MSTEFTPAEGISSTSQPRQSDASVNLHIDYPERLSRWLLLVKWLFVIPSVIVLFLYGMAVFITTFISFWAILFTGRYPGGLFGFARGYMALQARTYAYFPLLLTDQYPLASRLEAEKDVRYEIEEPERLSRGLLLLKLLSFLLDVVGTLTGVMAFVLFLAAIPAWFAILFTGRYPRGVFDFMVAVAQWIARATAWEYLLRDEWRLFATTPVVGLFVGTGALAAALLGLLAITPLAGSAILQDFRIDGVAMEPTLQKSDYALVNKRSYLFGSPGRGDIIVFHSPMNVKRDLIKRIIGVPGDTVEIDRKTSTVIVNGYAIDEPYVRGATTCHITCAWVVPDDAYFVMGDNRPNSTDSRQGWFVPEDNIIGKVWLRYRPLSGFGLVD
jgi:signal peptidase I